ncbi:hypothetical protein DPEC_G00123560 [Dallia pectoralis]|uniref:Uncharacterized protein n=1 Tax=Dallia pectoralis TaxID=75939 RepID=A0ACC2GQG5_DALPE|nr:hypothetical protein DPEC_G00123560 [Dallia pectoralis]
MTQAASVDFKLASTIMETSWPGEYLSSHDKCHPCYPTCSRCTGPEMEDCVSCPARRFLHHGECVIQCPPGRYGMEGQCLLCHHSCQECDDEGPDNCTSCGDKFQTDRYFYGGECREACPEGFFPTLQRHCETCPVNCSVCTSSDLCVQCSTSHYLRDGLCVALQCAKGELEVSGDDECLLCEEGCRTCRPNDPKQCVTCVKEYYQFQTDCYRICPNGTYGVNTMACVTCEDQRCVNCDQNQCYWCAEGFYLSDGGCVEQCEMGFFVDEENQECEPCHRTCRSCDGPNYDDCDSCEDDITLTNGECVESGSDSCPEKHFPKGQGKCEQCHSSCQTCTGSGVDECNTCSQGHFLTAQQACLTECPSGTFGNATSGRCDDCLPGCDLCQNGTQCQKCRSGRIRLYLQDGHCVPECQRGYPRKGECQPCAPECAHCQGNASHCLSCAKDYQLLGHACRGRCPAGYYSCEGQCLRCPSDCLECSEGGLCKECDEYYFLYEDSCVDYCPEGFFPSEGQRECVSCHTNCASCDGPDADDCDLCRNPAAVRYNGECLDGCPSDTYLHIATSECRDCDRSCVTCSGPESSSCLSCGLNMQKDSGGHCVSSSNCFSNTNEDVTGDCQTCHPSCHQCSGPSRADCLSCHPETLLFNQTCVDECPVGFYGDTVGHACKRCHDSCLSCAGRHGVQCTSCRPGLFKQGHSCVETCAASHFGNTTTGRCDRCYPSCDTCTGRGIGDCLKCREGFFYLRQTGGQCVQTCPKNYYPEDIYNKCLKCHPTCKTCSAGGPLFCTSCFKGFRFIGGICDSRCSVGSYDASPISSSNPQCKECDTSCLACKGPGSGDCILCPAGELLADDGRCLTCCRNGTRPKSGPIPFDCCDCRTSSVECILGVNFMFRGIEELPEWHPMHFIMTTMLLVLGLGAALFLVLHMRSKAGAAQYQTKTGGYQKLDSNGNGRGASVYQESAYGEYNDRIVDDDDDEEDADDDEDIVYMGQDGTVYRKFKYGLLEEDDIEMEYDDESYSFR